MARFLVRVIFMIIGTLMALYLGMYLYKDMGQSIEWSMVAAISIGRFLLLFSTMIVQAIFGNR